MKAWDVIISGAGIIGVSLALELRRRGAQVLLLDRSDPGKEASSAAAGMLSAADPETPAQLRTLARASAGLYPKFVEDLEHASGMEVDFRRGAIALLPRAEEAPAEHRLLSSSDLKSREPALDAGNYAAYFLGLENSVDPALLMQAALRAARAEGVQIRGQTTVRRMNSAGGSVEFITDSERFVARVGVNCQGAWAGAPVRPRKGQMLYLQPQNPVLLRNVVRTPEVYLMPRSSGKVLAGATVEDVGYDKTIDRRAIQELQQAAIRFVPELVSAPMISAWAGLRPGTPDDLPILGATDEPGVFIATGHFRNGILLAPITAQIMADLIAGKHSSIDISAFSPGRFASAMSRSH